MAPVITPVRTATTLPATTTVVVIGGGIVGLTAALALAERHIPVVLLEKGRLAGEQSSRNLGWVRKTSRMADDIPLAQASDRLWAAMPERIGQDGLPPGRHYVCRAHGGADGDARGLAEIR